MVMQIFQIRLSLEATKNIFINSFGSACFFGGYSDMKKGGWDYNTFNYLREEEKILIQDSDVLTSSTEWIHDPIFVEYSTVCGTDPGFSTPKSLNSFSIRKTKGKLL